MNSNIRTPDNAVVTITLYKADPFYTEYAFGIEAKTDKDDPQHLEQITIMMDILKRYHRDCEKAVLGKVLNISRDVRKKLKAEAAEAERVAKEVSNFSAPGDKQ